MSGRLTLAIVAVALAIAGAWAGERIAAGRRIEAISYAPASADALPTGYPRLDLAMPALALTDQDGAPFTQASFAGKPTILTFAFAHCHTVCPVVVDGARRAAERIGEDRVRLAVVTLDPWRDTPSRLQSMHANWRLPASARVLSGSVEDVTAALDALNVGWQRDEDTGDVTHPPLVYLVDADGRIAFAFSNPPVPWLAEAMDRLAGDEG
jgi:cytochrome oxidase Cu insertion factor (SCO1/SenC/PrrC family)